GYQEFRALPEKQAAQIDLFVAATDVYWNLWATGGTHLYPQYLPGLEERINETADFVVRYVRKQGAL
ncbi:MAG: hypothetical protein MUO40_01925, partial [Anaerolineaceae bacterium]|nr:hypothetical protein [Anaerolineaceae bacterium]